MIPFNIAERLVRLHKGSDVMRRNRVSLAGTLIRSSAAIVGLTLLLAIQPASSSRSENSIPVVKSEMSSVLDPVSVITSAPFAPSLSATKTATDVNGGNAEPGDTLMYSVTLSNGGPDPATNVMFTDMIDANTTLVMGSVNVSPLAGNDAYTTIGNTRLKVGSASVSGPEVVIPGDSLFDNDMEFLGDTFTLDTFQNPSAQGGNVSINPVFGHLDYVPPVGFTGTDTFTYTIKDSAGKTSTATVTITVTEMVWYVNNASAAGGDGRSTSPFQTLAPVNGAGGAGDADDPNEFIYVHTGSGNYTTGIGLETGQKLIGQGVALVVASLTLNPAGAKPTITNSGGNGVTLASGNTVRGLVAQTTAAGGASAGIGGSSVGNLNADTVQAVGNPGAAVDIQTAGTLGVTLESASSTTGAQGLRVTGATGGTFTVSGATTITNATATGINLATNGATTFNFSGGVTVSVTAGTGILAASSGTVNVSGGTVVATGGPALNVNPTTIGMTFTSLTSTGSTTTGISLTSASGSLSSGSTTVTDAAGIGISVNTSSATLNFGTTSVTNPDANTTGNTGVSLLTNTGTITFGALNISPEQNQRGLLATENTMTITTTSGTISTTSATAVEITRSSSTTPLMMTLTKVSMNEASGSGGTSGLILTRTSGSFTVAGDGGASNNGSGGSIKSSSGNGVAIDAATNVSLGYMNIQNSGDSGIKGLNVNGFTLNRSNVTTNGNSTSDDGIRFGEPSGTFVGVIGTVAITNSSVNGNAHNNVHLRNTSGTIDSFTVTNSTFNDLNDTFGANAFLFEMSGTAVTTVASISGCTFTNNSPQRALEVQTHDTGRIGNTSAIPATYFTVSGNTFTNNGIHASFTQDSSSNNAFKFINNGTLASPMTGTVLQAVNVFSSSQATGGTIVATISGNHINNGATVASGISVVIQGQTDATMLIDGNRIRSTPDARGIAVAFRGPAPPLASSLGPNTVTSDVTLTNNDVDPGPAPSGFPLSAIMIEADNQTGADNKAPTVRADVRGNIVPSTTTFDLLPTQLAYYEYDAAGGHGIGQLVDTPPASADATAQLTSTNTGTASAFGVALIAGPITTPLSVFRGGVADSGSLSLPPEEGKGPPSACVAASSERQSEEQVNKLQDAELQWTVQAALARWEQLEIAAEDLARLRAVSFEMADLPGDQFADVSSTHVKIDKTAAGYGWYFDETPQEDGEFQVLVPDKELQTTDLSIAHGKMDLLTVVIRELGYVYMQGKDRLPKKERKNLQPLMEGTLSPGVRRLPLDQWKVTPSPIGSIKPSTDDKSVKQASSQHAGAQVESSTANVQTDRAKIPADARYAVFNPATDQAAISDEMLKPVVMRADPAGFASNYRSRARRVAVMTPSGETVSFGPFTLPAGKSITVMFNVTINDPLPNGVCSVSNQGTVTADGGINIQTDGDAGMMGAQPTVTTIVTVPTISCPANITTDTDPGQCTAVETFAPTVTGCPVPTVMCSPASGFAFPKGVTTVTCSATNSAGSANCSFTVTVNDNENPTITCPANATTNTDSGLCTAVVNYTVPSPMDNCPGANVVCAPNTGTAFPKGTTTVTCTVTDAGGLMAQCSFTVTVNDTENPMLIGCPSNISTTPPAGQCTVTVNYTPPTASDNCPGVGTPMCAPASGSSFSVGMTTVTCSVSDAAGNTAMCSFTVTVTDNQPPSITCPPNMLISTGAGCATVNYTTPTPTDNCPGAMVVCAPASGMCFPVGMTTVTCTATDASSNTASCSFTIEVVQCTISCPSNITTNNDAGQCSSVVSYSNPTTTGSCGTVTCNPASGSSFPVGTTTVTCSTSVGPSCSFTVTVNDTENPTVMCPSNITQGTDAGMCAAIVNYTVPTGADNCPGVSVACSPNTGTSFPTGTTTVTCTATDASGNTAMCSFSVTINDDDAPSITCPSPVTQSTDAGVCTAVVSYSAPMVSDNCSGVGTPVCTPPTGSTFPKGVTTVGCTVSDGAGNTANCSFTVTVNDMQPPSITCPSNIVTGNTAGQCSAVVTFMATAMDNCPGVGVACAPASGSTFPVGTTTVTCTATDASSNTAMCSFTVTVNDTQAPSIVCPPTQVAPPGVVNYPAPTSSDNCAVMMTVCTPPSGSSFPAGFTTVTCTATDTSGNTASCSFIVTTFDVAIRSDSGGGAIFINTLTGDYMVCCGGMIVSGKGTIVKKGCVLTLTHNSGNRRLTLTYDTCQKKGQGVLQMPPGTVKCTIIDSDTRDSIVAPCGNGS